MSTKAQAAEEEKLLAAIKASHTPRCTPFVMGRVFHLQSHGVTLVHTRGGVAGGLSLDEPHPSGKRVHLDRDGTLVWPVLFLYPEFGQTDLVEAFAENHLFEEHIEAMLGKECPPWDVKGQYIPSNVEVGVRG